jgi:hypothetical protein
MSDKEISLSEDPTTVKSAKPKNEKLSKLHSKFISLCKGVKTSVKIIIALSLVISLVLVGWLIFAAGEDGNLTTISNSSLEKIIEINELSTVDYTYNATVTKTTADGSEIMYHVAYEGTVTAGIDFQKISFDINKEDKIITITIPDIEIQEIRVNMGTMDYIFTKDKYETETVSQEAYKLCKADLQKRIQDAEELKKTAKENVVSSVKALFQPWIETIDKEYTVVVQ